MNDKKYVVIKNLNMLIPFYLMVSYLYYEKDISIISDDKFDRICKTILRNWNKIEHYHKYLISKEDLEAGTGYAIKFPSITKASAESLVAKNKKIFFLKKLLDS